MSWPLGRGGREKGREGAEDGVESELSFLGPAPQLITFPNPLANEVISLSHYLRSVAFKAWASTPPLFSNVFQVIICFESKTAVVTVIIYLSLITWIQRMYYSVEKPLATYGKVPNFVFWLSYL